jgi:hypothetical protein
MNVGDVFLSVFYLLVMFSPLAFVVAFLWLVAYYTNASWLAHIRRLVEEQGFRVRELKRLWFNTAFPGKARPTQHEWLARVVVEDREGRLRSGWVRWRRVRLWDMNEQWTIEWDELPCAQPARRTGTPAMKPILLALIVVGVALDANAQSTGHPACDRFIAMVNECIRTKMPVSERADKQQQIDHFREMLSNPMLGSTVATKCDENIRLEMQRDKYGCYAARAEAAGVQTACTLVTVDELSSILQLPYQAGTPGNSKCSYDPRDGAAGRGVTIEVAWRDGREQMKAWRAGVRMVRREMQKVSSTPAVEAVTIDGVADDAYLIAAGFMPFLAVRRGEVAITVQAAAPRDQLIAIARKALARLP